MLSLLVGTSLVFDFLVTSVVNCTECNLFLPLGLKSFINFCILGLGVLDLVSASLCVLLVWPKIYGCCGSPVVDLDIFGYPGYVLSDLLLLRKSGYILGFILVPFFLFLVLPGGP